jgi:hypothetical protein
MRICISPTRASDIGSNNNNTLCFPITYSVTFILQYKKARLKKDWTPGIFVHDWEWPDERNSYTHVRIHRQVASMIYKKGIVAFKQTNIQIPFIKRLMHMLDYSMNNLKNVVLFVRQQLSKAE